MHNGGSERKKHTKRVASFVLSVILILTSHPVSIINAAEVSPDVTVPEDYVYEETVSEGTVSDDTSETEPDTEEMSPWDDVSCDAASEDTVSGDTVTVETVSNDAFVEDIPDGAFADNIEIENPEPLEEFKTPASEVSDGIGIMSTGPSKAASYAVSYNGVAEGLLPFNICNQRPSSLCWAFSAALLAEVSMIKNRLAPRSVHYSEDQIGYFFYHHQTDPLGGTAGDETIIVPSSKNYFNRGGNNFFTNWSLAAWTSVRDQADMPFKGSAYTEGEVSADLAYNSTAHMQNSYWFSMESTGNDISYIENVKELVYRYGAASVIIYSGTYINENHAAYNTTDKLGHNVSIIGWDDDFSAGLFSTRPAGDGAWYIRDNYGTEGYRDENGCYWMSYYDNGLRRSNNKAIAFEFEKGDNYDNNYQYDGCGGGTSLAWAGKTGIAANVFTAQSDEILEAVGFAPASAEVDYRIRIYKLVSADSAPDSGTKVSDTEGTTRYVGYRTVPLKEKVSLSAGQVYSAIVSITAKNENARLFIDADYDANSNPAENWLSFRPSSSSNQSYANFGNVWYDMHGYNNKYRTFRIKAYTNDTDDMRASYELLDTDDYTYDGVTEHKVKVSVVSSNGVSMNEGTDYSVSYLNNINPGTARVSVSSLNGKSLGNRYFTFDISPRSLSESFVSAVSSCGYTGSAQKPEAALSDDLLGPLKKGIDYNVEYKNNVNAGTGHVTFYGIGRYTGSITRPFTIAPKDESHFEIEDIGAVWYTGSEVCPEPVVRDRELGTTLDKGVDYTLAYENNINEGTASVSINGIGNYTGGVSRNFVIKKNTILIEGLKDAVYTGSAIEQNFSVKDMDTGIVLSKDTQYTVSYKDNKNAGTAKVYVSLLGDYPDEPIEKSFIIAPKTVSCFDVAEIPAMQYTGSEVCPEPVVTDRDLCTVLEKGKDYTVSYNDNINEGTASVSINGIGNYTGGVSRNFVIKKKTIVIEGLKDAVYTGSAIEQDFSVKDMDTGEVLRKDAQYSVSYKDNINAGTAKVYISISENYPDGPIEKSFIIAPKPASCFDVTDIPAKKYNGSEICPEPAVTDRDLCTVLEKGKDYTVSYNNNINEGSAQVYITGKGNYEGRIEKGFFISGAPEKQLTVRKIKDIRFAPGEGALIPAVTVLDGKTALTEDRDYKMTLSGNDRAGTATVSIDGISRTVYDNSHAVAQFTILPYPVKKAVIEGIGDRLYYEGKDYSKEGISINVYVKSALTGQIITLKEGTDYKLEFDEETKIPAKAGKRVYYSIIGIGSYSGRVKKYFTVRDYIPISDPEQFEISLSCDEYTYSGSAFRPEVKVTWKIDGDPADTEDLLENEDFRCTYSSNKNAGRACVTIRPTSSFTREYRVKGNAMVYFTILPYEIRGCEMKKPQKELTLSYNSKIRKPAVTVFKSDGKQLASSQYYVKYENNICVGTARISVYGKKNHTGLLCSQTFEIAPQSFGKVKLKYRYDRTAGKFAYFRVFYGSSELRENIDYRLAESGPDKNGNHTVSVNAIEGRNFTDDVTKTVKYKK
ncbi:MAG: hypothetical protein IK139_01030 [Lachnospiraceae bacterium]|nr:hypothetical protein [Lachnospiraceae bacterium]